MKTYIKKIDIDKPKTKKQYFIEDVSDICKGLLFLGIYSIFVLLLIYIHDIIVY